MPDFPRAVTLDSRKSADSFGDLSDLEPETREWVETVAAECELEGHHMRLLIGAGVAWDRSQQARKVLNAKGLTTFDRFRQEKVRPEVEVERSSLNTFRLLVRELGLDLPQPGDHRPPRIGG